jgi:hypothetical protein
MTNLDDCDISLMIYGNCKLPITSKKRGRPCAIDRYKTDLIQQKFTNILNSNSSHQTTHLAQNIMPFIVKRQRRQRANNRERTRMQTLNEALIVLRQHLPIDLYLKSKTNSDSQTEIKPHKQLNSSVSLKITKIDTLRFAAEYIRLLTDVLRDCEKPETSRACFKNEVSFTSDTSNNSESNVSESSGISFDYNAIKSNESFAAGFNSNYYQPYYYYHNHHHHHHQTGFYNSINQAAIYNF